MLFKQILILESQEKVAKELGISQSAFAKQIESCNDSIRNFLKSNFGCSMVKTLTYFIY
ncbi:hypothetical protein GH741_11730 [Aquibacillus halophilus]|uniref:Uncharacterized protein n=1 Tax=Aquibacillus halophilus TaxID=930132 RepID=A0A6A8DCH0_9BACI|nr:hypothetical protein [Aquibacillus halophilus]